MSRKLRVMKSCGGMEVQLHSLTWALDGGLQSSARSSSPLPPPWRIELQLTVEYRLGLSQNPSGRFGGEENCFPFW
jgi:hypothetical protein